MKAIQMQTMVAFQVKSIITADSFEIFWNDENLSGLTNSNLNPESIHLSAVLNLGVSKQIPL